MMFKFKLENLLDKITRWSIYLTLALVPVVFLPITSSPLFLSKQLIFTTLIFIAFTAWAVNAIAQGKVSLYKGYLHYILGALVIFSLISAALSKARWIGFVGLTGGEVSSFINVLGFVLLFCLIASNFTKERERQILLNIILASSVVVLAFSVWQFTQGSTLNLVGTTSGLAIYLGMAFILAFTLPQNKWLTALAVLLFLTSWLINFWVVFLGWLVVGFILLAKELKEKKRSQAKIFLILGILLISLLAVVVWSGLVDLNLPVLSLPPEISPSFNSSWVIAKNTLGESVKNIILGAGPGTYEYKYALYRNPVLNKTIFWNVRFSQGFSSPFTHLVEDGLIGTVLWLAFFFAVVWEGLRKRKEWPVVLALIFLLIAVIFYSQNFVIYFSFFALAGILAGSIGKRKVYETKKTTVFLIMVLTLLLVIFLLYFQIQRYIGAVYFNKGLTNQSEEAIAQAVKLDPYNDFHLRTASLFYFDQVRNSEDQKEFINKFNTAVQLARRAVDLNSINSLNWFNLAEIYGTAIGTIDGAADQAYPAYEQAAKLEPSNPAIYASWGIAHINAGELSEGVDSLTKALDLKPDLALARYWLAVAYQKQGKIQEAVEQLKIAQQINPSEPQIQELLNQLQQPAASQQPSTDNQQPSADEQQP